jgi:hypothetical protein
LDVTTLLVKKETPFRRGEDPTWALYVQDLCVFVMVLSRKGVTNDLVAVRMIAAWRGVHALGPYGAILVSGSDDGTIKLWDTQTGTCLKTLRSARPYEQMDITDVKGLTAAQKVTLKALGAIEN